jgi:hypothetical protein
MLAVGVDGEVLERTTAQTSKPIAAPFRRRYPDRAPSCCERFGSGHVYGLLMRKGCSPLALMIRPHGSLPHHSVALILALTAILASKPFPLTHIISSAPSMLVALGGETPIE